MHVTSAECVAAARGALEGEAQANLDLHVQRCVACAEELRFWRHIAIIAERDREYEPPFAAVEAMKQHVVGQPSGRLSPVAWAADRLRALVATLVFDTLEQPLPVGVRGGASGARQLLYEAPPLFIDLRLEGSGRSPRVRLAGQIVNAHRSDEGGEGAHVAVGGPAAEVATVMANQFGEFQCEFDRRDDLTLFVSLKDGKAIVIPLDRLPISGYDDGTADHQGKTTT